jgi:hypothetical protein
MFAARKKASTAIETLALSAFIMLLTVYLFWFGFHFPTYRDNALWIRLKADDPHLSSSMTLSGTLFLSRRDWMIVARQFIAGIG